MITFKPLRQYLTETGHNLLWLQKAAGIGKSTCTSLNNDRVISLEIVEKICLNLGVEIQQVMQYKDNLTGETPKPLTGEHIDKTHSEYLIDKDIKKMNKAIERGRKIHPEASDDEILYLMSKPDFSPLIDILRDRSFLQVDIERQLELRKNLISLMKNGTKTKYENLRKISDFLSVPTIQLYIDKKNPGRFKKYEYIEENK